MPGSTESSALLSRTFDLDAFLDRGCMLALDTERVLVGWHEERAVPDDFEFFTPQFYFQKSVNETATPGQPNFQPSRYQILERSHLRSCLNESALPDVIRALEWREPHRADFDRQFELIRNAFRSRGLKKAVPVVFANAHAEPTKSFRLHLLKNALDQPAHLYPYGIWNNESGMIGVTPEILFSQTEAVRIETVALAGTRKKSANPNSDRDAFLNDPKERHEHQLVIDDIAQVLSEIATVKVGETRAVELPTLFHLKTEISATLTETASFSTLMERLHPTPALGIAPRSLGLTMMQTWEPPRNRMRFGAPFGARFPHEGREERHCLVAIRNIQWQGDEISLGSGCGVVPESDPDREWAELALKRDSVRRMLKI